MNSTYSPAQLLAFEQDIADRFAAGQIAAPVHLSGGNEAALIDIFRDVQTEDWVLCGWRSHYHCLLKGVPPAQVKAAVLEGRSVSLCFPHYKVLSSGIVGAIAPIAVGIAWSLKRRNDEGFGLTSQVYCFLGDMSAESGIVHEAMKYAARHALPIKWVIEDNGKSVCTDTQDSWGCHGGEPEMLRYTYELSRPHAGIGQWVRF